MLVEFCKALAYLSTKQLIVPLSIWIWKTLKNGSNMRTLCRYCFFISVIQFSRDLFYAESIVFDSIHKEKRLQSSWSTLKPLRFLLLSFEEIKVFKPFFLKLQYWYSLQKLPTTPKLLVWSRIISRAKVWEMFILNLTETLRNLINGRKEFHKCLFCLL